MHQHNAGQRVPSCPKKNRGHRCLRARLHKEAETTEVPRQSSRLRRPEHCINLGRVLAAFLTALRVLLDQKHVALRERPRRPVSSSNVTLPASRYISSLDLVVREEYAAMAWLPQSLDKKTWIRAGAARADGELQHHRTCGISCSGSPQTYKPWHLDSESA
ncbi:hypothetical protein CBM2623_B160004 [Cupriavidus taiwanensis]|nr:hypothetical protein CBM2608_B140004 [Cupriavidus taiwanensis]SPA32543.1 hypothetical protein CBM2623_B160004 [Cupriavidus taiwanensis]